MQLLQAAPVRAAPQQQTSALIDISLSPGGPLTIAPNGQAVLDFTATSFGIDYFTSMTVARGDGDCTGLCPVVATQGANLTFPDFSEFGPLSIPATLAMPNLPAGASVSRTFYFTVTARGAVDPRTEILPRTLQQVRLHVTVAYFTVVVNGNGPVLPTATSVPPPATATIVIDALTTTPPPVSTATPAGPSPTPPPIPPTSTPGSATPPPATPTIALTPFTITRRNWLPLSIRLAGDETEPNNTVVSAQPISVGSIVKGALNDERDVYALTLPATATLKLSVDGGLQALATRIQLQLFRPDASPPLFQDTSAMPLRLEVTALPPGTYFIIVYTDPRFLAPATAYELRVR